MPVEPINQWTRNIGTTMTISEILDAEQPALRERLITNIARMSDEYIHTALEDRTDETTVDLRYAFTYDLTGETIYIPTITAHVEGPNPHIGSEAERVRLILGGILDSGTWPTRLRREGQIVAGRAASMAGNSVVPGLTQRLAEFTERDRELTEALRDAAESEPGDGDNNCPCELCRSQEVRGSGSREDPVPPRTRPDDRRTAAARRLP